MANSTLKSAALLDQMKLHLATDAGKDLTKEIGFVYQLNIAPKKIGFDEEVYVVDLKKGEVKMGGLILCSSMGIDKSFTSICRPGANPPLPKLEIGLGGGFLTTGTLRYPLLISPSSSY